VKQALAQKRARRRIVKTRTKLPQGEPLLPSSSLLFRWAIISNVRTLRLSRRKQVVEEYFDCRSMNQTGSRYNIARPAYPVIRQNPKEPVRELSLVRWGSSIMGEGSFYRARMINARSKQQPRSRVPRCFEIPQVLDSCGWFLRVEARRENQAAILLEINEGELFASRDMGPLEDASGKPVETCSILTTTPMP